MKLFGNGNEAKRVAWVEKQLKALPAGSRLLDAGAGQQRYKDCCSHLEYVSQDFAQYDGKGDQTGFQMGTFDYKNVDIISDITSIPRPNESFDAILCTEVFEHIPNPIAAIKELSRLLKKGGTLILTAPFWSSTHYAPYHFYSGFNRYFYKHFLPENQLEILELTPNGDYFEAVAQEMVQILRVYRITKGKKMSKFKKAKYIYMTYALSKLSKKIKGTEEMLCFGYFVLAKKL
jgi:SAM-dependent methyltransferase